MSAIRQNSSISSPHVALAVILTLRAVLKGFGNKPPFGPDSKNRWDGYVLSGSCRRSVKKSDFQNDALKTSPYAYDLINDLIYKSKWSNFVLLSFCIPFNVSQLLNLSLKHFLKFLYVTKT